MAAAWAAASGSRQNNWNAWSNNSKCSRRCTITARKAAWTCRRSPISIVFRAASALSASPGPSGRPERRNNLVKASKLVAICPPAPVAEASKGWPPAMMRAGSRSGVTRPEPPQSAVPLPRPSAWRCHPGISATRRAFHPPRPAQAPWRQVRLKPAPNQSSPPHRGV